MMLEALLSIQWKEQSEGAKKLAEGLKGENPLAEFSTANNLASELAPFATLLCDPVMLTFLAETESQPLWRALVANTVYWTVRRSLGDKDRDQVIRKIFNYDESNHTQLLDDDTEEPEVVPLHDFWDEDVASTYASKHKFLYDSKLYRNLQGLAVGFKAAGKNKTHEIFNFARISEEEFGSKTVGMSLKLFCHVEIVKSILTKSETDRYGENSIGFHATEEDARQFLKSNVRALYRKQYLSDLKLKQERIKERKLQNFLAGFTRMPFDSFAQELDENVPNSNCKGMDKIVKDLAENVDSTVDMVDKLQLLLTGRRGELVWNNGAVIRTGKDLLLNLLEPLMKHDKYIEIKEYVDQNSWHRYRDIPNRQGNSNSK